MNLWGIAFASEKEMRREAAELVGDNLEVELAPMSYMCTINLFCIRGKKVRLFLCGDYEFLCRIFGPGEPERHFFITW